MFIKQIIMQGFASYKDHTVVSLDPGFNVVLGENGSGKSNLFRAVEFVLGIQRGKEIHNAKYSVSYQKIQTTFVELVIDNSDSTFNIEEEEVRIRRSIIDSKDQYTINQKQYKKFEVTKFIENAGLSAKYLTYIVNEGQLNAVATASDAKRLKALEEATGSRQFDDNLQKIIQVIHQSAAKEEEVKEYSEIINKRKQNLQQSVDALQQLRAIQRENVAIMQCISNLTALENQDRIQTLEQQRQHVQWSQEGLERNIVRCSHLAMITRIEKVSIERDTNLKEQLLEVYKTNNLKRRKNMTALKLEIEEIQREIKTLQKNEACKLKLLSEKNELEKKLSDIENELESVTEPNTELIEKEFGIIMELEFMEETRKLLLDRRIDRGEEQRIQSELNLINNCIAELKSHEESMNLELAQSEIEEAEDRKKLIKLEKATKKTNDELMTSYATINDFNNIFMDFQHKICPLNCKLRVLHAKSKAYLEDLVKSKRLLYSRLDEDVLSGCLSMDTLISAYNKNPENAVKDCINMKHYYKRVVDNFTCNVHTYRAIEAALDRKLFYHIVETSKLAESFCAVLESDAEAGGQAGFIPLDSLEVPAMVENQNYPMLIDQIQYDAKFDKVMRNLFGNIAIVKEITEANVPELLETGLNFVTRRGVYLSANGRSYVLGTDISHSNIYLAKHVADYEKKYEDVTLQEMETYKELAITEQTAIAMQNRDHSIHTELVSMRHYNARTAVETKFKLLANIEDRHLLKQHLRETKIIIYGMETRKEGLENALKKVTLLAADKERKLKELNQKIPEVRLERLRIDSQRTKLNYDLIACRFYQYTKLLDKIVFKEERRLLPDRDVNECNALINKRETLLKHFETEIQSSEKIRDTNYKDISQHQTRLLEAQTSLEKFLKEKVTYVKQWDDCQRKIDTLAETLKILQKMPSLQDQSVDSINVTAYEADMEKLAELDVNELKDKLKRNNAAIENFPPVNMLAAVQSEKLEDWLDNITPGYIALLRMPVVIDALIKAYMSTKFKVIENAFNAMSLHFESTFRTLVGTGHAKLQIFKVDENSISSGDTIESNAVYSGVGIEVSFRQGHDTDFLIQLSGGQKSIVAVAFILSLQSLKPSPFYFLDEVDHALDPTYRENLAYVIRERSNNAQFVTSTFWPEQLQYAVKFHGVSSRRKASSIREISKEAALEFVISGVSHTPNQ